MTASRPFRLLLFGPAGSGKGTVARKILADFDLHYLCAGDELRAQQRHQTPLGLQVGDYLKQGRLVPDKWITDLMTEQLRKLSHTNVLLDGFPRTREQALSLDAVASPDLVFELHVPLEEILRRLSQRYIHSPSGRVYNLEYNPPKTPGIDDVTGERLVRREDDESETIRKRWEGYAKTEALVCKHYSDLGRLMRFAGKTSDEIYSKLKPVLEQRFAARGARQTKAKI